MWEWSEHLKLGKASAFVKRDLRSLPLTEAEFEADFFLSAYPKTGTGTWTEGPSPGFGIGSKTDIAKTKKLRPRFEAMAAEDKAIELDINDWSTVLPALAGAKAKEIPARKHMLRIAIKVANRLAEALDIGVPPSWLEKKCR